MFGGVGGYVKVVLVGGHCSGGGIVVVVVQ